MKVITVVAAIKNDARANQWLLKTQNPRSDKSIGVAVKTPVAGRKGTVYMNTTARMLLEKFLLSGSVINSLAIMLTDKHAGIEKIISNESITITFAETFFVSCIFLMTGGGWRSSLIIDMQCISLWVKAIRFVFILFLELLHMHLNWPCFHRTLSSSLN